MLFEGETDFDIRVEQIQVITLGLGTQLKAEFIKTREDLLRARADARADRDEE